MPLFHFPPLRLPTPIMATTTLRRTCPRGTRIASIRNQHRHLHNSSAVSTKKESLQDKDSINTDSNEYSKSGGDKAAAHSDTAFDPNETRPEQEEVSRIIESFKRDADVYTE